MKLGIEAPAAVRVMRGELACVEEKIPEVAPPLVGPRQEVA